MPFIYIAKNIFKKSVKIFAHCKKALYICVIKGIKNNQTMQNVTTQKGTSSLERQHQVERLQVIFVDHINQKAQNMLLQVAPNGDWFEDRSLRFDFQRYYSILDGSWKDILQVPFGGSIEVETSIGTIRLTRNKAELISSGLQVGDFVLSKVNPSGIVYAIYAIEGTVASVVTLGFDIWQEEVYRFNRGNCYEIEINLLKPYNSEA